MEDRIGREIRGYRVEAEIGRGARAVVYRATQVALQRTVALKVFSEGVAADPGVRPRIAGASLAVGLDHPHLLPVYEAGEAGGVAFVAMRLVDGPALDAVLRAPAGVEVRRALFILHQVAEALDHLAGGGIAHGGVTAANVLLGPGDRAYLSDPGSGAADVAPEGDDGPAADRYALAALALAALTGRPQGVPGDRTPASAVNPALGPAVDAALARGLAKDPAGRPTGAVAFVDALEAAVAATPGAAASRPGLPPSDGVVAVPPPPPPPPGTGTGRAPEQANPPPRWRVPAIVAATIAALVVVIAVIGLATDGGAQRTVTTAVAAATPQAPATTAPPATTATTSPGLQATFPVGAVLPGSVAGWTLAGTDPGVINLELADEGEVETAQATRGSDIALVAAVRPDRADGRVVVERLRDDLGGAEEGPVALGGAAGEGIAQTRGGVTVVSFATADLVVFTFADERAAAVDLARATSEAIGP